MTAPKSHQLVMEEAEGRLASLPLGTADCDRCTANELVIYMVKMFPRTYSTVAVTHVPYLIVYFVADVWEYPVWSIGLKQYKTSCNGHDREV